MKRAVNLVPIFGIALFVIFYFYAASLYPGGTRLDPASPGYSHAHNFWCDLLDSTSERRRWKGGASFKDS